MNNFSDIDTSDEDRARPKRLSVQKPRGQGRMRTKECPGCSAVFAVSTKECIYCDYQFTSRSMLTNQYTATEESCFIRDRFPFEPERVNINYDDKFIYYLIYIQSGG